MFLEYTRKHIFHIVNIKNKPFINLPFVYIDASCLELGHVLIDLVVCAFSHYNFSVSYFSPFRSFHQFYFPYILLFVYLW